MRGAGSEEVARRQREGVPRHLAEGLVNTHDLTPSEVALAKVLSAWVEWPGVPLVFVDKGPTNTLLRITEILELNGLVHAGQPTPAGAAILDRARKAGVL